MKLKLGSLICALAVVAGCAGEATEPTYPVSGVVRFKGEPLAGAVVSFTGGGKSAVGTTDASGRYTLTTHKAGDGAPAGHYKVAISKYDNPAGDESAAAAPSGPQDIDVNEPFVEEYPEDYDEMQESEKAAMTATNILPNKYATGDTSGLEVDVTEGSNTHDFDIEDEAGAPSSE